MKIAAGSLVVRAAEPVEKVYLHPVIVQLAPAFLDATAASVKCLY